MAYIGEIGKRLTVTVTFKKSFEYQDFKFNYYGTTHYIHTFEDAEGNVLVWKTTSSMAVQLDDDGCKWHTIGWGDIIQITGTVKDHTEYRGTQQTVLTRCKYSLIERHITKEERDAMKAEEQIASLTGEDFIWEMPYKQYKEHYSDCETLAGSYNNYSYLATPVPPTIKVIIREGRLKNSGVRGKHFAGYRFKVEGYAVTYRAVSEENAVKQMKKDFPNATSWELVHIYQYNH